eukprot:m.58608 g.58608  ORF g.58608 m.58608 type:complete len:84 (+) comp11189_c0_seq1:244-495(+)
MAELHVIGELVGGRDFPNQNLFCKWEAVQGPAWERLAGEASGQTQVDHPLDGTFAKWAHPIGKLVKILITSIIWSVCALLLSE